VALLSHKAYSIARENRVEHRWNLLTTHGQTLRDIAITHGLTERQAYDLVNDLVEGQCAAASPW